MISRTSPLRWRAGSSEIGRASCRERGQISVVAGSSRRRHTRYWRDWSSDVCSSDLFHHIHSGPYRVLIDNTGILADAVFTWPDVERQEQAETLRRLIYWFWHDLSHFTAAMARGQL